MTTRTLRTSLARPITLLLFVFLGGRVLACVSGNETEIHPPVGTGGADAQPEASDAQAEGLDALPDAFDASKDLGQGGSDALPDTTAPDSDASPGQDADAAPNDGAVQDAKSEDANASCKSNADCVGSLLGGVCDLATGICVECLASDDTCPLGEYCNGSNKCASGCKSSADCGANMTCNPSTHSCVGCVTDDQCPPGALCQGSTCVPGCTPQHDCPTGKSCCGTTCVDEQADPANCGACSNACQVLHGTAGCTAGSCAVKACDVGWSDCDGLYGTGCEAHTDADTQHCGGCANACSTVNATPQCVAGACVLTCSSGFADCDKVAATGCEADVATDVMNCGACAAKCSTNGGVPSCSAGKCSITCSAGHQDCNANPADGCEANTSTDPSNCGACKTVCSVVPHGIPGCTAGSCSISLCASGYSDCNNVYSDGCEVYTATSVTNCGACGTTCLADHGTAGCSAGQCTIAACWAGYANCNALVLDGCEVSMLTDPNNCGACGVVCPAVPHATTGCSKGACAVGACDSGWADCDGIASNGCEVATTADMNNCGGCGKICSAPNATTACVAGSCAITGCNAGTANCNGLPADGCEVNTGSDPLNCGGCLQACSAPNATSGCASGQCTIAGCNAGWGNCNAVVADGCEDNLGNDVSNCGACGTKCSSLCASFVTATTCANAQCAITACTAGHIDIDGVCSSGCECAASSTSFACVAPTALGTLQVGQTTTYTGNLVPAGQEAYLSVTFAGNTSTSYHPHVALTAGSGEFAFDILVTCQGQAIGCGIEGGSSTGRTDWETYYSGGDPASTFIPIPAVGNGGSVIIHVYRRTGKPVTCNNYTLTVSN
jgi:hypothetical protein